MKICLINFSLTYGSGISVRKIAEALKNNGNEVFIITSCIDLKKSFFSCLKFLRPKIVEIEGIRVYIFYPFLSFIPINGVNIGKVFTALNFWNFWTYICVKKILKKEKPDIVHTNCFLYLSLAFFTAIKSLNIPVVHTVHDFMLLNIHYGFLNPLTEKKIDETSFFDKLFVKIYSFITLKIINSIPKIVASPSIEWIKPHLKYGFFKDCKKIEVPNFVDGKKFRNAYENKKKNGKKETFDIIYVGRIEYVKGTDILVKAFKKLSNKNVRLHIIGSYTHFPQSINFKDMIKDDKRIFVYGDVPNSEIPKYYEIADVGVFPYRGISGMGRVVIESLSAGVPPIVTRFQDTAKEIRHHVNGFLFEEGNIEQLKEILEYVINNPEVIEKMAKECIETAKKWDIDENKGVWEKIYKDAIFLQQQQNER